MLKNKHTIIALIVAPILALIAYFAVDFAVKETPHAAKAGASYALVSLPNCRYPSGQCTLKNAEFKLDLSVEEVGVNVFTLNVKSQYPLQGAKVASVESASETGSPLEMHTVDQSQQHWNAKLAGNISPNSLIQLVVAANDAYYYGETELLFSQYETSFGKDFR